MQIEVTEKEAREIYSQRYFNSLGKRKFLPFAILVLGAIIGFACCIVVSQGNEWLGVTALAILLSPAIYMSLRAKKASRKYFIDQMMEHHPGEILRHSQIEGQK